MLTSSLETPEGLELGLSVVYYSRFHFISRLLPVLRTAAKFGSGNYPPRIVNVCAAGLESTEVFLHDMNLEEPGVVTISNFSKHVATLVTLSLKRFAEKPENDGIVFIHAHPGLVTTDLFRKSWGDQWDDNGYTPSSGPFSQSTPEEAGQKALYLVTSAEYGGNGVGMPDGRSAGSTLNNQPRGSLFSVNDVMVGIHQDEVLGELDAMGAPDAIWDYTVKTLTPWQ
jgi:NAD(P)-dependent dehydrogenase (short-subunit alcohol dehydrogenase family)